MNLHLSMQSTSSPEAPPVIFTVPVSALPATFGQGAQATIDLAGLPPQALLLSRGQGNAFSARLLAPELPAAISGQPLTPGQDSPLRNGDELVVGEWRVRLQVVFPCQPRPLGHAAAGQPGPIIVLLGRSWRSACGCWVTRAAPPGRRWPPCTYALLSIRTTVHHPPPAAGDLPWPPVDDRRGTGRLAFHLRTYETA
jgi:hypothetical protein